MGRAGWGPVVPLEVDAVFRASWDTYKRATWPLMFPGVLLLGIFMVSYVVLFVFGFLSARGPFQLGNAYSDTYGYSRYQTGQTVMILGFYGVILVMQVILQIGSAHVALRAARGQPTRADDFFRSARHWPAAFAVNLLLFLPLLFGCALAIAPGVILLVRTWMWPYVMVDRRVGPLRAIAESWHLTSGRLGPLFVLGLVFGLLRAAAGCCCVVDPLLTMPLQAVAGALAYTALAGTAPRGTYLPQTAR